MQARIMEIGNESPYLAALVVELEPTATPGNLPLYAALMFSQIRHGRHWILPAEFTLPAL
jgi:hypothetical protein